MSASYALDNRQQGQGNYYAHRNQLGQGKDFAAKPCKMGCELTMSSPRNAGSRRPRSPASLARWPSQSVTAVLARQHLTPPPLCYVFSTNTPGPIKARPRRIIFYVICNLDILVSKDRLGDQPLVNNNRPAFGRRTQTRQHRGKRSGDLLFGLTQC